jgi:hypothetical protein
MHFNSSRSSSQRKPQLEEQWRESNGSAQRKQQQDSQQAAASQMALLAMQLLLHLPHALYHPALLAPAMLRHNCQLLQRRWLLLWVGCPLVPTLACWLCSCSSLAAPTLCVRCCWIVRM